MLSRLSSWWYGNKTTLKPSLTGTESEPVVKDALSQFTDLLENEKSKINNLRNEWMLHMEQVLASGPAKAEDEHASKCPKETQENVESIVKLFFAKIKGMFQTAKANLSDQINKEVREHIRPLEKHIEKLCAKANDKTRSEEQRRRDIVHICSASIALLNELEHLTSNIADEIASCLKIENREEETAKIAINAGLFMFAGLIRIVLPPVDFDFTQDYRNFLSDEIQTPEVEFECDLAEAKGKLKMADGLVEVYTHNLSRRGSGGIFSQPTLAPANESEIPAPITTLMIRPQ
jgi:hypothetical protein